MNLITRFLTLFMVIEYMVRSCQCTNSSNGCREAERKALLKFKQSLNDPGHILSSWEGVDCCKWYGVGCDSNIGYVVKVDLQSYENEWRDYSSFALEAKRLDSSLLQLKYLNYLDLSGNNFNGNLIPEFLGEMNGLKHLNLSYTNFTTGLFPSWLGSLTNLQVLDLSDIDLSGVRNLLPTLNKFHSLSVLSLSYCQLDNTQILPTYSNQTFFSSLRVIDLSFNNFVNGSVPLWLADLKELEYLDLSGNSFNKVEGGLWRLLSGLCHLVHLNLGGNQLSGTIPNSIGNLTSLKILDLSFNQLHGAIPTIMGNLTALRTLFLHNNRLSGVVPDSIGRLANLKEIYIYSNYLSGNISETHLSNLNKLRVLHFSSNQLTIIVSPEWIPPFQLKKMNMDSCEFGTVFPRWLRTQKELQWLYLSNASITGPWPTWFQSSHLVKLDLSHNEISGHIPNNIPDLLPGLSSLQLSDNLLNGTIPSTFCKMENLEELDISTNMLSGNIPSCLGDIQNITILMLSFNKLTGVIPRSIGNFSNLQWLQLDNNRLEGEIPSSLRNCESLMVMNLVENKLSGNIPEWIGGMRKLHILGLRNNSFDGYIPKQLCQMSSLRILTLADNSFTGNIPSCLGNLTAMTIKPLIDIGDVYAYIWTRQTLAVIIKGRILKYTTSLRLMVNIDLSRNNLVGIIPPELTQLSALIGLNLSYNHLTGTIPENIGSLTTLESLDLSNNQLSGSIPIGISHIHSLSSLNLSYNNLSGRIPTGNQLQTLIDPSIYEGNPNLCGTPLAKRCVGDEPVHVPNSNEENDDEEEDKYDKVMLLAITTGYAVGLWAFFGILVFKKKWRYAYFRYVDYAIDWIYVFIVVNARRFKRKMMGIYK